MRRTPSQEASISGSPLRSRTPSQTPSRTSSRSPDLRTKSPLSRLGSGSITLSRLGSGSSRSRFSTRAIPDLSAAEGGAVKGRDAIKAVAPGQVVEEECLHQQVRETKCRIYQDGYVLHVEAAYCQARLKAWHDEEAKQKLELIESALDCHIDLQPDLLTKIAACFVSKTVPWGAVLATQKEPVEDIFIAQTAACGMRMDLCFERLVQDAHTQYSRPATKCRKTFDISNAGPKDCLGLGEFFATGCWDATVHVVESGTVLQASRKRLFSILEYYPHHMDKLRQQEAKKLDTKHERLLMLLANFQQQVCAG